MIEIYTGLFIGNQLEYESDREFFDGWYIVHACKEPYHRNAVGYTTRAAPLDDPEYLFAERGSEISLNLVDANDPVYIPVEIIDKALNVIDLALGNGEKVFLHCNQGLSRSPTIGLLFLAARRFKQFTYEDALSVFIDLYPDYAPNRGMSEYAKLNWNKYQNRESLL